MIGCAASVTSVIPPCISADICSCADAMSEDIFACTSGLASILLAFVVSVDISPLKSTFF